MSIRIRTGLGVLVVVAAFVATEGAAHAVLSGTNGRIAFASGRGEANDSTSKLYMRPTIGSVGAGTAQLISGATGAGQHRHPTWSPDRTMIAFARGDQATANFDIYILDLTSGVPIAQNITNTNAVTDDRPAWSPDGNTIAFESEDVDGSNQINVKLYDVASGNITDFTSPMTGTYEHKPAWTPDSQSIYFTAGNPTGSNMDIYRQPIGGGPVPILTDPTANEFQPSISPDGTRMCFTRGTGAGFNTTARVRVALANGGGQMDLPGNAATGDYNCTWSPDGTKIAYVQGTFSNGDLVMENSDLSLGLLPLESTVMRFDGNPDWAPDGNPRCEDVEVDTPVNTPVEIPIQCADTGPRYEQTDVRAFVDGNPTNGTVTNEVLDLPASITYTPNNRFIGTDSFVIRSFDQVAFGDRAGTVTVNVLAPPNDFTFGLVKKNKRKGTAKISVHVPGPGDLALEGTGRSKPDAERANAQGGVVMNLKPNAKGKRKLRKKGKLPVNATVTYTPDNGQPNTLQTQVKLKRKRKR
jgi:dipeptidyl aminopeptidase/acylaminoacyl peptidase